MLFILIRFLCIYLQYILGYLTYLYFQDPKKCQKERATLWLHYKPSLFQHIGTHSSLKGKVQKLKDKQVKL